MPKYNFHDIKDQVKKGDALPEDINKPVKEYLEKNGLEFVVKMLEKKERLVQCGKITAYHVNNPFKRIEIKTNFGMVEGFDKISEEKDENGIWVIDETHIKNTNLDMTKRK